METKKDKILNKLRKLMNLKESAAELGNEGEANAAAAGITRLLLEYNLTENDIPDQEKLENPVISEKVPVKAEISGSWYGYLIKIVCEYNMCRCLATRTPNYNGRLQCNGYMLVGRKKNVEVVMYLILFLVNQFISIGKHNYAQYKSECILKYGVPPKSLIMYLRSFLYGCVIGLAKKFENEKKAMEKETNITALACTSKSEIDDFLKDVKTTKGRKSKAEVDALCVSQGIKVGKNIEIHRGVNTERTNKNQRLQ